VTAQSRAVFRAWAAMHDAGLTSVVVRLEPVEHSDGWEYFPAVVAAARDGRAVYAPQRVADAVWAAAEAKGVADGPVAMTVPGSGVWRVELAECACDPWRDDGPCTACSGTGFVWWRKAAGGAA